MYYRGEFCMVKAQHVVPREDGSWAVRSERAKRASKVEPTKYSAIRYAHQVAKRNNVHLIIHNRDGTIKKFDELPHYPSMVVDALLAAT